jgi:hypothetical protein
MPKASGLKIDLCLLAVALLGASAAEASIAKQVRTHHTSGPSASAPPRDARSLSAGVSGHSAKSKIRVPAETGAGPKGEGVGDAPIAKGVNPVDTQPRDTIDAPITVLSPRPGFGPDKGRNAAAGFKVAAPGNFQVRRAPAAGSSNLVARNAIGLLVARHEDVNGRSAAHFGSMVANPGALAGARGLSGPNIGRTNPAPAPVATASILNRGKIDGTGLIRPALAPASLGGPAKSIAGIDGTTFRPKH